MIDSVAGWFSMFWQGQRWKINPKRCVDTNSARWIGRPLFYAMSRALRTPTVEVTAEPDERSSSLQYAAQWRSCQFLMVAEFAFSIYILCMGIESLEGVRL